MDALAKSIEEEGICIYTKILVPLDGSERSERVLPPARSIVKSLKLDVELLQGNAATKIVDITQATHDNLVAIRTHCRSGIGRWVLGSVTDRIVHHTDSPVLVIRASH